MTALKVINADGIADAWVQSASHLLQNKSELGMVLNIENPSSDLDPLSAADPSKFEAVMTLADVANTIFPSRWERFESTGPFFTHYKRVYERLQRKSRSWGVYFQRLIDFGEKHENQLEHILRCMNLWGHRHRGTFVLHLSSPETDRFRRMGNPCWQYGEFLRERPSNELSIACVYRSHDYFQKAMGNFVGIARLLEFVAHHTNSDVGRIICMSAYAHYSGTKSTMEQIISQQ